MLVRTKYFRPKTLKEALSLVSQYGKKSRVMAGGTDLLVQMKRGKVLPHYIIDIGGIRGRDYITYSERDGLKIGAQTTIHAIASSSLIRESFSILSQAASQLAVAKIRMRATMAGNLCNASPSAETAPALIALGASITISAADSERTVPIENFFTGPGKTVLKPDELVTGILIPNPLPRSSGVYIKHTLRKAMDLAIVGVACLITIDGDIVSNVKIALGAVAPIPIRAKEAENILRGNSIKEDLIQKAAQTASEESKPIDDVRSSARYRRSMVKVLVERAIKTAIEQIKV